MYFFIYTLTYISVPSYLSIYLSMSVLNDFVHSRYL